MILSKYASPLTIGLKLKATLIRRLRIIGQTPLLTYRFTCARNPVHRRRLPVVQYGTQPRFHT